MVAKQLYSVTSGITDFLRPCIERTDVADGAAHRWAERLCRELKG